MLRYECKKVFINNHALVIVLFLLFVNCLICTQKSIKYETDKEIYREYVTIWAGEFDSEKQSEIEAERTRITKLISSENEMKEKYLNGDITDEEYRHYTNELWKAHDREYVIDYIYNKTFYYDSVSSFSPHIFYDLEIEYYLNNLNIDWTLLLSVCIVPLIILTEEYRTSAHQLLLTTLNGRKKTYRSKTAIVILYSVIISAITIVAQTIIAEIRYDFGDMNVPVQSIKGMELCELALSVKEFMLCISAMKIFSSLCIGLLVFAISTIVKNAITLSFASVCIIYITYLLTEILPLWLLKIIPILGFCSVNHLLSAGLFKQWHILIISYSIVFVYSLTASLIGYFAFAGSKRSKI